MSTSDRNAEMAAKVAKLKTELILAEAEADRTAALKEYQENAEERTCRSQSRNGRRD